jgi:ATP-dependent Clp protease adaptor protein ClpS
MSKGTSNKPFERHDDSSELQNLYTLVLYNDDVNHYEFVVKSLVEVCRHNQEQAEQCTLIAHHKGKCDVKNGSLRELRSLRDELTKRGLSSIILEN